MEAKSLDKDKLIVPSDEGELFRLESGRDALHKLHRVTEFGFEYEPIYNNGYILST